MVGEGFICPPVWFILDSVDVFILAAFPRCVRIQVCLIECAIQRTMQPEKRRVLLVSSKHLFGEGLEEILRKVGDVELLGPLELSQEIMITQLPELRPDAVILVEEGENKMSVSYLTAAILRQFPRLPIISAELEQSICRVYSTQTLPARSSDLVEAIMNLPQNDQWDAP